jgi:hypothetical protein
MRKAYCTIRNAANIPAYTYDTSYQVSDLPISIQHWPTDVIRQARQQQRTGTHKKQKGRMSMTKRDKKKEQQSP